MGLEPGNSRPDGLVITNPLGSDPPSEGDNHIRLLKDALKTWAGAAGAVALLTDYLDANYADETELAALQAEVDANTANVATNAGNIATLDAEKAPLDSPALINTASLDGSALISADPNNYLKNLRTVIHAHASGSLDLTLHNNKMVKLTGGATIINQVANDRMDFFNASAGDLIISGLTGCAGNGVTAGTQVTLPATFGGTLIIESGSLCYWIGAGSVA